MIGASLCGDVIDQGVSPIGRPIVVTAHQHTVGIIQFKQGVQIIERLTCTVTGRCGFDCECIACSDIDRIDVDGVKPA